MITILNKGVYMFEKCFGFLKSYLPKQDEVEKEDKCNKKVACKCCSKENKTTKTKETKKTTQSKKTKKVK
jgi:hypothetical protein